MPDSVVRHLVLDNEAASALLSSKRRDRKRASVIEAVAAANGVRLVPTAVRGEAGWDRTQPAAAAANRLVAADDTLDAEGANRVVQLRAAVPAASVVDAAVALGAERAGSEGGVVEVLTSDVADLTASPDTSRPASTSCVSEPRRHTTPRPVVVSASMG